MSFDKFAWLDAIRQDDSLAPGVKYVLQNIALLHTRHNGDPKFYARQNTVAEELKVSVRLVKTAYCAARDGGYFVLDGAKRSRGRGNYDTYLLQVPANSQPPTKEAHSAPFSDVKGAQSAPFSGDKGAQTDDKRGTKCTEKGHETQIKGAQQNAGTSENPEEAGREKQGKKQEETSRGERAQVTAPAPGTDLVVVADSVAAKQTDGPPPLFCPKHDPDGPKGVWCPACADQRRICERYEGSPEDLEWRTRQALKAKSLSGADRKAIDWLAFGHEPEIGPGEVA